jgi:tetratricopeptide (TPR) repeat protein
MRRNGWRLFAAAAVAVILAVQPATADDADTCTMASRRDLAIAACTRLIASGRYKGRDLAITYRNRGYAWRYKGDFNRAIADYDRAIADYTEAIRLDPKNAVAYNNRGNAWGAKDDLDRAVADYDQAIGINPKFVAPYKNRCLARAIAGRNLPQALSDCDQALGLRPKDARTMDSRGFVYLRLGRLDDAIVEYDAVLKLAPKVATSLFGRGIAKQRNGDTAGGDADMAAAKAIDASIAEKFANYGVK